MRVNGLKLRTKRVLGAFSLLLALCFASGFITAKLSDRDTGGLAAPAVVEVWDSQFPSPNADDGESHIESDESVESRIRRYRRTHRDLSQVIEESFGPYDALMKRGHLYLSLALFERARRDFDQAIKHKDDSWEAYLGRGRASLGLGDFEEAEFDLLESYDLRPSSPEACFYVARLYRAQGKAIEAGKYYELAILRFRGNDSVRTEWAELCEEANDFKKARELYSKNVKSADDIERELAILGLKRIDSVLGGLPTKRDQSTETEVLTTKLLLARAQADLQREEDWESARESLTQALRLAREDHAVRAAFSAWRLSEGKILTRSEKTHREILTLLSLLSKQQAQRAALGAEFAALSRNSLSSWEEALVNASLFGDQLSRESYRERLSKSESDSARSFRSACLPKQDLSRFEHPSQNYYEKRRRSLSRMLYFNPWHYQARYERARISARLNNRGWEAIRDLKTVLAADSKHWQARLQLAQALAKPGAERNLHAAREQFTNAIKQIHKSSDLQSDSEMMLSLAQAYFNRAKVNEQLSSSSLIEGAMAGVLADLAAAATLVPRNTPLGLRRAEEYLREKAELELRSGHPHAAQKDCEEAQSCREKRLKLAVKYYEKGTEARENRRYNDAIKDFKLSIAYDPTRAQVIYDRGLCYLKIGNFIPGVFDFCKAVELDYQFNPQLYNKVYQCTYVVDLKRVIAEINRCVEDHPNDAHVLFLKGFFYVAATEFRDFDNSHLPIGEEALTRAIELNPNFISAYEKRAYLRQKISKLREAHEDLNKVEELYSKAWDAQFLRALVLAKELPNVRDAERRTEMIEMAKSKMKTFLKHRKESADRVLRYKELNNLFSTEEALRQFVKENLPPSSGAE